MDNSRETPDKRRREYSALTPEQRSQRARLAALSRWARQDGRQGTQAARDAFLVGFEQRVDPDGLLEPVERLRRATAARRVYFQRMAWRRRQSGRG